jgi:hypothetical protein
MADDFCLDEDAGVAYVTTHRENTIDRVPLQPGSARLIVAGDPFDDQLVGPSSAAWGRRPGDYGRIVYVTSDGGLVAPPPDGIVRPPKLLRADLPANGTASGAIPSPGMRSDAAPTRLAIRGALPLVSEISWATPTSARSQIQKPADSDS